MKYNLFHPRNSKCQFEAISKDNLLKQNPCSLLCLRQYSPKEEVKVIEGLTIQGKKESAFNREEMLLLEDRNNKEVQLKDIEKLNKVYSFRNKRFPYKNSSGERPKKLAKLVRVEEEEQLTTSQRTRNLNFIDKNVRVKKKSSSLKEIRTKRKDIERIVKNQVVTESRNRMPNFKTPC